MAVIFSVEDIYYRYPGQEMPIFTGLRVEVPLGARVGVLGCCGVGKSTLMSLLGLLWEGPLDQGRIVYQPDCARSAIDYSSLSNKRRKAELRLSDFGFIFQTSVLMPTLTCAENIALPLILQGWSERRWRPRVEVLLRAVNSTGPRLLNLANKLGPFSGGESRCIAVLRAVVHNPKVLFADEPLTNLDRLSASAVLDILDRWHRGQLVEEPSLGQRTILLATHDLEEAYQFCDSFLVFSPDRKIVGNRVFSKGEVDSYGGVRCLHQWIAGASDAA